MVAPDHRAMKPVAVDVSIRIEDVRVVAWRCPLIDIGHPRPGQAG
jgi:hypothetical protein